MRRHRLSSALAGALAVTALAAPAGSARPITEPSSPPGSPSLEYVGDPGPTVTRTIDDGFDWGSAAIGAGSAAAVLLAGAAGASAARHRRVSAVR